MVDLLDRQTDRKILFVVDERGGAGKSALCRWLLRRGDTWACQGGSGRDLMFSYDTSAKTAVFDMARCNNPDWWPWNFMENIKNGWFTSTKYAGRMECFRPPNIVVFTNEDPNREKFSKDRYQIFKINESLFE